MQVIDIRDGFPNIARNVRKLRIARGYSREQLAFESRVSKKTIERIEKNFPSRPYTLRLIADALGVDVETLAASDAEFSHPSPRYLPMSSSVGLPAWFVRHMSTHRGSYGLQTIANQLICVEFIQSVVQDASGDFWLDVILLAPSQISKFSHPTDVLTCFFGTLEGQISTLKASNIIAAYELAAVRINPAPARYFAR
jgi:transcriptional regulator with XRE-family HTH domain